MRLCRLCHQRCLRVRAGGGPTALYQCGGGSSQSTGDQVRTQLIQEPSGSPGIAGKGERIRMIIDFHTHYLAREHLQMHAKTPDGRTVGSSIRGEGKDAVMETNGLPLGTSCKPEDFCDLAARLEFMAATGVDVEVLSPPPFMSFTEIAGSEAAKLVREQNEAIAEGGRLYPDSFRGLCVAPFQDAGNAVAENAYLIDTLGL